MPKITYTASRFSLSQFELWSSVTLQHNKEFIMFIFFIIIIISLYLMFLSMCNLQKRLIRAAFWVLLQATFTERLKTNGTAIKIRREIVMSRIYIEFSKSIQSMKKHYFYWHQKPTKLVYEICLIPIVLRGKLKTKFMIFASHRISSIN